MLMADQTKTQLQQLAETVPPENDIAHRLMDQNAFPHLVKQLRLLETHISWVLLTGAHAYKIKKPVKLPFVDYSTPELRSHFCHEELRLNQSLASGIYEKVVPIMDCCGKLNIDGDGFPVDYAVCMKEFPQANIFDRMLRDQRLERGQIDQLAQLIATAHESADRKRPEGAAAYLQTLHQQSAENLDYLAKHLQDAQLLEQFRTISNWTTAEFARLKPVLLQRVQQGMVRQCHGDLHLQNIIWFDQAVHAFDCIEFSDDLQMIDCMNDIAFPMMDLVAHQRVDLAHRLLTLYLEASGDYAGLHVLRFFIIYRALVRAKVNLILNKSSSKSGSVAAYLQTALATIPTKQPELTITFGLSGSGKSTAAINLVETTGAIRVRSDVERTRLLSDVPAAEKYTAANSKRVYQHLLQLAELITGSGFRVVVDATFLQKPQRDQFRLLAERLQLPFSILACASDLDTMKSRVRQRTGDASEADEDLIDVQLENMDPLSEDEKLLTLDQPR
jgi:aminoglycoside phosphotransferase family enzyme/predicted kinase